MTTFCWMSPLTRPRDYLAESSRRATENMSSSVDSSRRDSSASRETTLSSARLERKRASDRMSQQTTRARTKAYIAHLERTTRTLTEANNGSGATVSKQLKEQHEEIENLKNVINRIATLANDVAGRSSAARSTDFKNHSSANLSNSIPHQIKRRENLSAEAAEYAGDHFPETFNPASHPNQQSLSEMYPTLNVKCGHNDRDYFEALDQALAMIERSHQRHQFSGPEVDDDISIRAVLHGWDAARAKNPFDIGWQLLQNLDQGLFFRSGSVERIAILRLVRSILMVLVNSRPVLSVLNCKQEKFDPNLPPERRPPSYMNPRYGTCRRSCSLLKQNN
jgi:hypothetical protein